VSVSSRVWTSIRPNGRSSLWNMPGSRLGPKAIFLGLAAAALLVLAVVGLYRPRLALAGTAALAAGVAACRWREFPVWAAVAVAPVYLVLTPLIGLNVSLSQAAAGMALALVVVGRLVTGTLGNVTSEVSRGVLVLWLVMTVSLAQHAWTPAALAAYSGQLAQIIWFLLGLYAVQSIRQARTLMAIAAVCGIGMAVFGLLQVALGSAWTRGFLGSPIGESLIGGYGARAARGGHVQYWEGEFLGGASVCTGFYHHGNFYAIYLGFVLWFCGAVCVTEKRRLLRAFYGIGTLLLAANVVMTQSMSGIAAPVLVGLGLALVMSRRRRPAFVALGAVAAMLAVLGLTSLPALLELSASGISAPAWRIRAGMWRYVLRHMSHGWWLGHGATVFPTTGGPILGHPHNVYLRFLYTHGVAGLAALVGILVLWIRSLLRWRPTDEVQRAMRRAFGAACACFMLLGIPQDPLWHGGNAAMFWLWLGISASCAREGQRCGQP